MFLDTVSQYAYWPSLHYCSPSTEEPSVPHTTSISSAFSNAWRKNVVVAVAVAAVVVVVVVVVVVASIISS